MEARSPSNLSDRCMRFTIRATSVDDGWSGIAALIYDTSGGFAQSQPAGYYCFSMHLSAPVHTVCRCEGKTSARLQVVGDIDLIPVGVSAAWEDDGPTTMIGVKLEPWMVRSEAENMGMSSDRIAVPPQLQLRDPLIEHLLWALRAELESDEPLGRVYAESLGTALASHLLRRYARPNIDGQRRIDSNRRLRRVLEYMHDNLSADLSLFELASIAGLSPTQFKVVFKQTVGMPVHQYVIRRRVEYAVGLIKGGDLPLSEIAMQAGFSSPSHMAKLVRQITGLSPAEIRDRL
jgi:AraC family transcriptional regulator